MEKKQAIKEKYGLLSKTKVIALLKYFYLFPTSLSVSSFLQRLSFHASLSTGHSGIKIKSASVTIPESKIRLISTKAKYIKRGGGGGGWKYHFSEPSMKLNQTKRYSNELLQSSWFYREQYGTVKKRRRNRWKPPFLAVFVVVISRWLRHFRNI